MTTERVAVYVRVSSEDQKEAGTIENQIDFARRYCDLHDLPVHQVYADDGVSGTVAVSERPGGRRLLSDAKAGKFQVVLVLKIDRLARSLWHLLNVYNELSECDVGICSMTEPLDTSSPIGRFVFQLLGSIAELERATIMERTALGRLRAARSGRWAGGQPPFGYRLEDKRLVVDDAEAAVVRRIFHLCVDEDMGIIPIAELFNAEGVPTVFTHRGVKTSRWPTQEHRWDNSVISRMLGNPIYTGRYVLGKSRGKALVECEAPAIVDAATFDAARRLLKERTTEASRNARRLYLLRGLVKCHCGRAIVGNGNHKRHAFEYVCPTWKHFRLRAEVLEGAVWAHLDAWGRNPGPAIAELHERLRAEAKEHIDVSQELADLSEQIAAKKAEQDTVITLFRKARITEAQLDNQLDALNVELRALEAHQKSLLERQAIAQMQETALISAEAILMRLGERLDEARDSPELQRELIKCLIASMTVDQDGSIHIRFRFADSSVETSRIRERVDSARFSSRAGSRIGARSETPQNCLGSRRLG